MVPSLMKMIIISAKKFPDVFTKAKRSEVMSRIRSRGNKDTELALAAVLRRHVEVRRREGGQVSFKVRPDFVFPRRRLAVFVDGCFWHGCPQHGTKPKGNGAFWRRKLAANQRRDRLVSRTLRRMGWRVVRLWEHELAHGKADRVLRRIGKYVRTDSVENLN